MKEENLIYLDTYILQQDMRIRLPKQILENLNAVNGKSKFAIYLDKKNNQLILKLTESKENSNGDKNKKESRNISIK